MRRRVVGIETEYGLTCATRSGAPPIHDADAAARLLFAPLALSGRAPNVYLRNGGRLYLDVGAHPRTRLPNATLLKTFLPSTAAVMSYSTNSMIEPVQNLRD